MSADSDLLALTFHPDNPCNTVIKDSKSGLVAYEVFTTHEETGKKRTVTSVKNAAGFVIASWEWRDVRSDVITFHGTGGDSKPIPANAWLHKSLVPFKDTVTLEDGNGRKLKWKGNGAGQSLELYTDDSKDLPIVRFHRPVRRLNRSTKPATLEEVEPAKLVFARRTSGGGGGGDDEQSNALQDLAIVSFLVLEKRRRGNEVSVLNRADALAAPGAGILAAGPAGTAS